MHNYKIRYRQKAKSRILADSLYYNMQQLELGKKYLDEINEKITLLTKHPRIAPKIDENYRKITLHKFSHSIVYAINEQKNEIVVLAIQHQKQHPDTWKNRK